MSEEERVWQDHAAEIISSLSGAMMKKYAAGQEEHGGRLWRKPMLKHMLAEAVDLNIYLATHIEQMQTVAALLRSALTKSHPESMRPLVEEALNLLEEGNREGVEEEELNAGLEEALGADF